jgi:hypothetical protein
MSTVLARVTPEEDGILRRLHSLEQFGARLAPPLIQLKAEIRSRDQRIDIREPKELAVLTSYCIT